MGYVHSGTCSKGVKYPYLGVLTPFEQVWAGTAMYLLDLMPINCIYRSGAHMGLARGGVEIPLFWPIWGYTGPGPYGLPAGFDADSTGYTLRSL